MTTTDTQHFRSDEQLDLVRTILAERRIPVAHRFVLHHFANGQGLRWIAAKAGMSKDSAHRLILGYVGNEDAATVAEVSPLRPGVAMDARRTRVARGTRGSRRPNAVSVAAIEYFELGMVFASTHCFRWQLDREIWALHMDGMSKRTIGRALGMLSDTVLFSINRVRKHFALWLKERANERD